MKKLSAICIIMVAFTGYIAISGYSGGPAQAGGYDCTGGETGLGNAAGCGIVNGCHSTTRDTGIHLTIEVDSVGVPTTNFFPGKSYTIKIKGVNNTSSNLPKFGFQVAATTSAIPLTTPANAGTFTAPYPANTHYAAPLAHDYVLDIVEHSTQLSPISGTGGTGTTYQEVINWKAPTGWVGVISIWVALNAVNNDGYADAADQWNTAQLLLFQGPAGIDEVTDNTDIKVYPNPCNGVFTINSSVNSSQWSAVEVYNLMGQKVYSSRMDPVGQFNIDLGHQPAGIYLYKLLSAEGSLLSGKIIVQ